MVEPVWPDVRAETQKRVAHMRGYPPWRWHLDEVFVKVNGKLCYLWRAVDHEGEVLEAVVTAKRDKAAALKRDVTARMSDHAAAQAGAIAGSQAVTAVTLQRTTPALAASAAASGRPKPPQQRRAYHDEDDKLGQDPLRPQ